MLCTESCPPLPLLILNPFPCTSELRRTSYFGIGRSAHPGVIVIHSPIYTFLCSSPNSASAPNSTSSIEVMLQECRNTCKRLWTLSIRSSLKSYFFSKALLYCRSKRSMRRSYISIERQSRIYYPSYSPASLKKVLMECRSSCVDVRTWTLWYSRSPTSYFDRRSCLINRRTCILIACCWEFTGPTEDGGVRSGDNTVGASGSGISRMCP